MRGSLHWEVVCPSKSNLQLWVEVSISLLPSRCIFLVNKFTIVFVSVALSFELSLSSIREMPPVFQCQDFPNFSYLKLCALIERYVIYRNQIFFQVHSLSFWALAKNLYVSAKNFIRLWGGRSGLCIRFFSRFTPSEWQILFYCFFNSLNFFP